MMSKNKFFMISMWKRFKKLLKKFFFINDTPAKVAGGAALGIFLGIFPGEGLLATLFFASIFRLNKLAATVGVMAVNMWTTFLLLPIAAGIGSFIFGENYFKIIDDFNKIHDVGNLKAMFFFSLSIFSEFTLPLFVSFFVVAGVMATSFYFLLLVLLKRKGVRHLKDVIKKTN